MPAQMVAQALGRHAVEGQQELLQLPVALVDRLDGVAAAQALSGRPVDGLVLDRQAARAARAACPAVRHQRDRRADSPLRPLIDLPASATDQPLQLACSGFGAPSAADIRLGRRKMRFTDKAAK